MPIQKEDLRKRLEELQVEAEEQKLSARGWILKVLLTIFAIGNLACISLYFLNGFGITKLTDGAMGSLAATTIAEVAGLLAIAIKFFFQKESDS